MSSRRYVKRLWRVPKDRGALEYLATLIVKMLVKHGWPASWRREPFTDGFVVVSHDHGEALPPDFLEAVQIAARIVARTYRVEIEQHGSFVGLLCDYEVMAGGHFKKLR